MDSQELTYIQTRFQQYVDTQDSPQHLLTGLLGLLFFDLLLEVKEMNSTLEKLVMNNYAKQEENEEEGIREEKGPSHITSKSAKASKK
jgi:hypothetical protein